jgi:hypothetical protein
LPKRCRTLTLKALAHFLRQSTDLRIDEVRWDFKPFIVSLTLDFGLLARDVTGIFGVDFDLLDHRSVCDPRTETRQLHQGLIPNLRTTQQFGH